MKITTKKCPFCSEEVIFDAKKCKHCGEWLNSKTNREIVPAKLLRNVFLSWSTTLAVFFLITWLTGFNFNDDGSNWYMLALFLDIGIGTLLFLLLIVLIFLRMLKPGRKPALNYLAGVFVATFLFFILLVNMPSGYLKDSQNSVSSNEISSSRDSCDESGTLVNAKNCTVLIIRDDGGHGTGFSVSPGYLITNKHVVEDAASLKTWINGEKPLTLWNYAPTLDIAVLKLPENIPTCNWFDSSALNLAEPVFALGWPETSYGDSTITRGVYSRLNQFDVGLEFVQTDAAINPGNSGGPLINECGVVGMNTQKEVWSTSDIPLEGLGNALSSKSIKPVIDSLIASGNINTEFPTSKNNYQASGGGNYVIPSSPVVSTEQVGSHLANLKNAKATWELARGNNNIPLDQLNILLDSFERQISFCETLISRLSGRSSTQDDLIMWDAIVKMSYESAALSSRLNGY